MNQAHLPSKISLLVIALFVSLSTAFSKQRPNIIFILVDDMGFSDIGCYGGEVNTPHLDRLAENGLRFTSMYNTSKCFPSRACLLTGVYAQQCGMNRSSKGIKNAITMADLLRTEGYRTLAVGKHHSNHSACLAVLNSSVPPLMGMRRGSDWKLPMWMVEGMVCISSTVKMDPSNESCLI